MPDPDPACAAFRRAQTHPATLYSADLLPASVPCRRLCFNAVRPQPRPDMKRFDDLYLFTRVVEAGGFSAAERATGIPKSRLSRRIAELEVQLGTRLLQR